VYSLINGVLEDHISMADRGLAYGDGLFETLRVIDGSPTLLDSHLARLHRGCERLGLDLEQGLLREEALALCKTAGTGDQVLKIIVTRASLGRGYRSNTRQTNRYLDLSLYAADRQTMLVGCAVCLSEVRLALQPLLAGIKHLNRLEQVLAATELPAGYQEGLMQDMQGHMIEGIRSNLFIIEKGHFMTPDLSQSGVSGVMRALILQIQSVEVKQLTLSEVLNADEVFVCNSVFGIYPVTRIDADGQVLARFKVGPVTRTCQDQLAKLTGIGR